MIQALEDMWIAIDKGGPVMVALILLSVLRYKSLFSLISVIRKVNRLRLESDAENATTIDLDEVKRVFGDSLRARLKFARVLTVAAPLLGLLGTVVGMLDTFAVLSEEKTQGTTLSVADGISVALLTTEAGLIVAIPALFLGEWIRRRGKLSELSLLKLSIVEEGKGVAV